MKPRWTVRLSLAAEHDFSEILRWTTGQLGPAQAQTYADTLSEAIAALASGPEAVGVRRRDDIGERLYSLHVARQGRKGRHFVVFRCEATGVVDVLRLLHDSMDPARHLPSDGEGAA
jgi:toxin ParE1/3/4